MEIQKRITASKYFAFLFLCLPALFFSLFIQLFSTNSILLSFSIPAQTLNMVFAVIPLVVSILLYVDFKGKDHASHPNLYLVLAFFSFAFLIFHSLYFSMLYDDAFISFRYVRNLLNGHGLVFNPGEYVEAYSNLLWVLMIGFLSFLLKPFGVGISLVSLFLSFISAAILVTMVKRYFTELSFIQGYYYYVPLLAVNTFFAFWLYGGIETIAFSAALTSAYCLLLGKSNRSLPWVFAMLILLRVDGFVYWIIFIVSMMIDRLADKNRPHLFAWLRNHRRVFMIPAFVFLSQVIFRLLYYGYPMPNTFYAKVGAGLPAKIGSGLEYIGNFYQINGALLLTFIVLFFFLEKRISGRLILTPLLAFSVLYIVYLGGDSLIHFRFLTHLIPLFLLVPILLVEYLSRQLKLPGLKLVYLVFIFIFFFQGNHGLFISLKNQFKGWYPLEQAKQEYEATYLLGNYFAHKYPEKSIALGAIGIIPFVAERMQVIDILGLADTHVAHLKEDKIDFHIGHNKWDIDHVLSLRPHIIIPPNYMFAKPPRKEEINNQALLYGADLIKSAAFNTNYLPRTRSAGNTHFLYFRRIAD